MAFCLGPAITVTGSLRILTGFPFNQTASELIPHGVTADFMMVYYSIGAGLCLHFARFVVFQFVIPYDRPETGKTADSSLFLHKKISGKIAFR